MLGTYKQKLNSCSSLPIQQHLSSGSTHEPTESAHSYYIILSIQGSKQKFQWKSHLPHSYYLLNTIGINIIWIIPFFLSLSLCGFSFFSFWRTILVFFVFYYNFVFYWLMEGYVSCVVFSWGSSTALFEVLLLLLHSDKFFLFTNYSIVVAINPCMLSAWLIVSALNLRSCLMISFVHH